MGTSVPGEGPVILSGQRSGHLGSPQREWQRRSPLPPQRTLMWLGRRHLRVPLGLGCGTWNLNKCCPLCVRCGERTVSASPYLHLMTLGLSLP